MAKYSGHEVGKVKPQINIPKEGPELTEEQVRSWWQTFSTNASTADELGVSFEDGKNLYYYTDEGNFARAVNEGESINSPDVQKRLMENSLNGRLFTRANDDVMPRQVVTNMAGQELEVGVATGGGFGEFYDDHLENAQRPAPLPFWKYLLWPFSSAVREEFKAHREATAKYDADEKDYLWLDGLEEKERPDMREDQHEEYKKEQKRIQDELDAKEAARLKAEQEERERQEALRRAEQEKVEKEAYQAEHAKRKERWGRDLGKEAYWTFLHNWNDLHEDAENGKIVREIVGNKYASYEDVMDGVVRLLEHGIYNATHDFIEDAVQEYIMVQQKPWQKAREGLREYMNGKLDENLVKAAFESHDGKSAATDALVTAVQELAKKLEHDKEYFRSRGVVTASSLDDAPLEVKNQGKRLRLQQKRNRDRRPDTQHLDESPETYRKEHDARKAKWDQDVTKMTQKEFRAYRFDLVDHYGDRRDNLEDFFDIVTHPQATVDDVYDYIAREMEALMFIDQFESKVTYELMSKNKYENMPNLTEEFVAIQREPWQKAKQAIKQFARDNISEKEVQGFLNKHDFEEKARLEFGKKIKKAYANVKDKFRDMGVIFERDELTPDVIRDLLVEKSKHEGPDFFKNLSENSKKYLPTQTAPQTQQPTVKQPTVETKTKSGPSVG